MKNKNVTVLGVDPGMNQTGWGVIEGKNMNFKHIANGCIISNNKWKVEKKLENIFYNLEKVIEEFKPMYGAVEKVFVNINAQSSLKLGHVRGALMLTLGLHKLKVHEFSTTAIKKSITGVGRADKKQIQMMVKVLLPKSNFKTEDEADALATAICYCSNCSSVVFYRLMNNFIFRNIPL